MTFLLWCTAALALLLVAAYVFARWQLAGPDLAPYDRPEWPLVVDRAEPSAGHAAVVGRIRELVDAQGQGSSGGGRERLSRMRAAMNAMGEGALGDAETRSESAAGVPGEWVLAPGYDASRRLLYIHGGAFVVGSAFSHRRLTAELSRRLGVAVLAIDYRLMPENSRRAGIDDCREAYRWLADNGPDGAGAAERLYVAGDSAGGNLTLALVNWARDGDARLPDAAIALSPLTDATMASPSLKTNLDTDPLLGPAFRRMTSVPNWVMLWFARAQNRMRPSDPDVSPVNAELSGLPPILVQASAAGNPAR